ncbi:coiled-coil domain-containing protein 102A-like protein [Gossypium australe]|uniref:Coiled-coil domain-containing protein 102A-like protein n=1 Tax=Gossypium australe TaxID=47621 RepID=A0A5B6V859_9ROSI|nr:coiled-coil domain-containing protein 102A-like protein [Gossypium australe]
MCVVVVGLVPQSFLEENYSPLKEIVATSRRDDISEENWIALLRNLQEEDVEWRAPWMVPDEVLYRCGSFDWVPLLGIWGAIGYAPLLVLRQYRSRQFISATYGLAQCEFLYKGDSYKKRVKEISNA